MRNTGISFVLLGLLIGIMYGPTSAYARDCEGNVDCREGEYCKGAGSITYCRDCEKECEGNFVCGLLCWLDNSRNDCGGLNISGTCETGAIIYQHANYEGLSQGLSIGRYDLSSISIGNDSLSSLKVPNGWKVTLYRHQHFTGETKVFTNDTAFVGEDFNDETSSIEVTNEPCVIIYKHAQYKGYSQALPPGRYDLSSISIGNDSLTSLKVPNGWKVTLYRHQHFTGETKVFTENAAFVGDDFSDQTSSIIVEN